MRALRVALMRVRASLGERGQAGDDFEDEVQSHLAMHVEACLRDGMAPEEARR